MLKRMDRYVYRGSDMTNDDAALIDDIYVPEMTRNGLAVEELPWEALDGEEAPDDEKAQYSCSICPELTLATLKAVRTHIKSKGHKKRVRLVKARELQDAPDGNDADDQNEEEMEKQEMARNLKKRQKAHNDKKKRTEGVPEGTDGKPAESKSKRPKLQFKESKSKERRRARREAERAAGGGAGGGAAGGAGGDGKQSNNVETKDKV